MTNKPVRKTRHGGTAKTYQELIAVPETTQRKAALIAYGQDNELKLTGVVRQAIREFIVAHEIPVPEKSEAEKLIKQFSEHALVK